MDGGAETGGSSRDHPKTGPTEGVAASGGSSQDHAEVGAVDRGAAADGSLLDFELTQDEYAELVKSTAPFHESVARIIQFDKKYRVVGTGSAFLVSRRGKRSLFLTCHHNFSTLKKGEARVIRFLHGDKDYKIEKIIGLDEDRDLLLFSVKDVGDRRQCLEFSTDAVKQFDNVVILGYSAPDLTLEKEQKLLLACVEKPSIFAGKVICHPYRTEKDMAYEKVINSCRATRGVSGSPLLKSGKVIAVHLGADKSWRDAVSINTVHHVLTGWLKERNDNGYTIKELLELFHDKEDKLKPEKKRR